MTYTNVHKILEGDAEQRERYKSLVARFELMRDLAAILNKKRVRRGSIDFDLPEPLIEFDDEGEMAGVTRAPRNNANRLIEEFMLAANEAVASHIESLDLPMMFRIHEQPDPKRVMEFEEVAVHFGYTLGLGAVPVKKFPMMVRGRDGKKRRHEVTIADPEISVTSRNYQKLIAKIEGKPEERILSYLMLRSLKQAKYLSRQQGSLRARREKLHALHFTHPPLSGFDGPSHFLGTCVPSTPSSPPNGPPSSSPKSPSPIPTPSAAPPTPNASSSNGRSRSL